MQMEAATPSSRRESGCTERRDSAPVSFWRQRHGVCDPDRSPILRAQRAEMKSRRDDMIIAPGKRSAARGYGRKMISSFFPSGWAPRRRAQPEGKKEGGWGGVLPRAAASAALP
jgi:hypothetical protein